MFIKFDHKETRTRNLLITSLTPYPLGYAALQSTELKKPGSGSSGARGFFFSCGGQFGENLQMNPKILCFTHKNFIFDPKLSFFNTHLSICGLQIVYFKAQVTLFVLKK